MDIYICVCDPVALHFNKKRNPMSSFGDININPLSKDMIH